MSNMDTLVSQSEGAYQHTFSDPDFMHGLRNQMLQFATLQLGEPHKAEDAVQDALCGALKNVQSFAGQSAFKTWVFAILKHKIADILRQGKRYIEVSSLLQADEESEDFAVLFDKTGHWQVDDRPKDWGQPDTAFKQQQFWDVFEICLSQLPAQQARVFMMREFLGLTTEEICEQVDMSVTNLHVILHRCRMRLRICLQQRWFGAQEGSYVEL